MTLSHTHSLTERGRKFNLDFIYWIRKPFFHSWIIASNSIMRLNPKQTNMVFFLPYLNCWTECWWILSASVAWWQIFDKSNSIVNPSDCRFHLISLFVIHCFILFWSLKSFISSFVEFYPFWCLGQGGYYVISLFKSFGINVSYILLELDDLHWHSFYCGRVKFLD